MTDFTFSGDHELELMSFAERYNAAIRQWIRAGLQPGQSVLDFGAGTGRYCNTLSDAQVVAVELDRRYHASIRCPVYSTVDEAPGDLDLIYAINVLEHIEDDRSVVQAFFRHLKPGGRIKVFVPAHPMLFSKMDERVGHFRRYTHYSLTELFLQERLRVVRCRYFDFLGFFASLAYKPVGDGGFSAASLRLYDRMIFPISRLCDLLTGGLITGKNLMIEAIR